MNCERNICYQQDYNGGCNTCPCNQTTKEAIENLKKLKSFHNSSYGSSIRIAIEALEKQVPKEPNYEGDGYSDGGFVYDTWICPNCGKYYEVDYDDYKYCPECGQRINWLTLE